jgi:hypothetical protein
VKVSDLLQKLTKEQRTGLHHMFELGEPHFVIVIVDGVRWYVGVHLYQLDHLVPLDKEGSWSCGVLNGR